MHSNVIVFDAVRRGYTDFDNASNQEIIDYFSSLDADSLAGHTNNIKGIVFELEVTNSLNEQGYDVLMFEETNHPVSDIAFLCDNDISAEVQLKATDSVSYINETLVVNDETPIIVTTEVATKIDSNMIIDSGIENEQLEILVSETLAGESSSVALEGSFEGLEEVLGESLSPVSLSPVGFLIRTLFGFPF